VRLFLNSIDKGMDIMRSAVIGAVCDKDDTGADIVLTIRIPKAF
jgi:ParB family chromosome partitioning protein